MNSAACHELSWVIPEVIELMFTPVLHHQEKTVHTRWRWHRPWRHKSVTGSVQVPTAPTSATLSSLSAHSCNHMEVPHHHMNEEENSGAPFTEDSVQQKVPPKRDGCSTMSLARTSLKDSDKRNPPNGQNFKQCTCLFILHGRRNGRRCHCIEM